MACEVLARHNVEAQLKVTNLQSLSVACQPSKVHAWVFVVLIPAAFSCRKGFPSAARFDHTFLNPEVGGCRSCNALWWM